MAFMVAVQVLVTRPQCSTSSARLRTMPLRMQHQLRLATCSHCGTNACLHHKRCFDGKQPLLSNRSMAQLPQG